MDFISKNPNPNVEFIVNSNLCVPDKIVDELIDSAKAMVLNNAISSFKLFASLDSVGEQAEYQRYGLDFEQFKRNVIRVLEEVPKGKVSFTCTFNVFSVPKVKEFMEYMKSLIDIYGDRINFDTPYLRYPPHQCIQILPNSYDKYLADAQTYMESVGFKSLPIEKIKRLRSYMANVTMTEEEIATYRKDFKIFVDEHDRRRNTNFAQIYPELLTFYNNI